MPKAGSAEVAGIVEAATLVEGRDRLHLVGSQGEVEEGEVLAETLGLGGLGDDRGAPLTPQRRTTWAGVRSTARAISVTTGLLRTESSAVAIPSWT